MISDPSTNRADAARAAIESVGGSLEGFYWMLGEQDGLAITDAPNTVPRTTTWSARRAGSAAGTC